jgi:DME family drug/metabolite transporter
VHTPNTTQASSTASSTGSPVRESGLIYLVAAGLLWGTGGLLGTLLANATGLGPAAVAVYRIGIGGLLLIVVLAGSRRPLPRGRAVLRRLCAVGALAATFQACYFTAVSLTSVSLATLVTIGSAPAMVLVGEQLTGRRRIDLRSVGVLVLAIVGLTLLIGFPAAGAQPAHVVAGLLFALASAASFAVFTLVCAIPVPGLDGIATTAYGFTLGAALLAPVAVFTGGLGFAVDPTSVTLLLALGGIPTALAYVCFFRGLIRVRAATAALTALLEPLTGAVLGAVFLGDRLGLIGWLGAAVLSAAVVLGALAERSGQREAGTPAPVPVPEGSDIP